MTDASQYSAQAIEVLQGLDPVRKRPGMYTDTQRPNHLAQEVIDNAVDEALAANPDVVEKIRGGKVQAAGAIVGAVMKATKGQADAARVRELVMAACS